MTANVTSILSELQTDLSAHVEGISFATGRRFLAANTRATPSVVWVPISNSFGSPRTTGKNPRQLKSNNATVAAHCWADDYETAEALLNAVVAAAHRCAHGSVAFGDADWFMPDYLTRGESVTLSLTFATAVTDDTLQTVVILGDSPMTPVEGDGLLERGEE